MSRTIVLIGDGAMPTICAQLLSGKGLTLRLYSAFAANAAELDRARENRRYLPGVPLPGELEITADPARAFRAASLAVAAVPTQFTRRWWETLRPHCPDGLPVCSAAKGIENGTLLRPTQIIADVLTGSPGGRWPMAALSGPCIAREIAARQPATAVAASGDPQLAHAIQDLFTCSYFRVYTNPDVIGVELAGAIKNVIAIAAGILDGLAVGDNAKAALLTRGLAEITRLGVELGGRRETFAGLAGLGDLVTTCISPHGRNRSFGEAVGKGEPAEAVLARTASVVEGVATTRSVMALAAAHKVDMPITAAVHAVLFEGKAPAAAVSDLMARPSKREY